MARVAGIVMRVGAVQYSMCSSITLLLYVGACEFIHPIDASMVTYHIAVLLLFLYCFVLAPSSTAVAMVTYKMYIWQRASSGRRRCELRSSGVDDFFWETLREHSGGVFCLFVLYVFFATRFSTFSVLFSSCFRLFFVFSFFFLQLRWF